MVSPHVLSSRTGVGVVTFFGRHCSKPAYMPAKNTLSFDEHGNVTMHDIDKEIFQPARKLVSDARNILTPGGIWGTISTQRGGAPIIPVVSGQYRPNNQDFKCPQQGHCPEGYHCIARSGEGRCYGLRWNRNH